ncbi:MAG TPA: phosphatase PAP2 family protein [Pyrinomonadaceae bacterium]
MRSYKRVLSILVICLVYFCVAQAQTPAPDKTPDESKSLEHEFFRNILKDQKAIWTSPFHLNRQDTKWLIPSVVGFGSLITTDRITGDEIGESESQVKLSREVSYAGSIYGLGAFAGTFYLIGRATKNDRARETGVLSAEALVDTAIVGGALKVITQRGRPLDGRERSEFFDGGSSFPSGHSIQVWSVATIVAHEYRESRAVQVAAYGLASAVSIARFTGHKHYLSDVVVGSAVGYGIGRYVFNAHHHTDSTDSDVTEHLNRMSWPAIEPLYNRHMGQYGVALTWNF